MTRIAKLSKLKTPSVCSIFEKQEKELNKLITKLVNAPDTRLKEMWSWGIMQGSNILLNCPHFNKRTTICKSCRVFAESRKNLANLVILGSRT